MWAFPLSVWHSNTCGIQSRHHSLCKPPVTSCFHINTHLHMCTKPSGTELCRFAVHQPGSLQPEGSPIDGQYRECKFNSLPHWLCLFEQEIAKQFGILWPMSIATYMHACRKCVALNGQLTLVQMLNQDFFSVWPLAVMKSNCNNSDWVI